MPLVFYGCKCRWAGGPPADAPETAEEALARIDQLYKDGVPFFTKDTIRSAFEQIQKQPNGGQKVFIRGVDGAVVVFDNDFDATRRRAHRSGDEELS